MVLDSKTHKKINEFIYSKPRSVDEVAKYIDKNWRTADRYLKQINEEQGTIGLRTFREGTRGALKIAFWNNIEKVHSTSFQEKLFKQIEQGRDKKDFSPFDIYQYIDDNQRSAFLEYRTNTNVTVNQNLINFLSSTEKQILHFSGNNSWISLTENNKKLIDVAEDLAKQGVKIKILSRIEIAGLGNVRKLLAINDRVGKEMIEIRHCYQPLRGFLIDNKEARFREELDPDMYKKGELKGEKAVFYEIKDEEWVEWLQRVFWNLFRTSIPAEKRINDLKSIHKFKF
jgi:predicted transcriptional regulator